MLQSSTIVCLCCPRRRLFQLNRQRYKSPFKEVLLVSCLIKNYFFGGVRAVAVAVTS